jgi:hypothetical protein
MRAFVSLCLCVFHPIHHVSFQPACTSLLSRENCLILVAITVSDRTQKPFAVHIETRERKASEIRCG